MPAANLIDGEFFWDYAAYRPPNYSADQTQKLKLVITVSSTVKYVLVFLAGVVLAAQVRKLPVLDKILPQV